MTKLSPKGRFIKSGGYKMLLDLATDPLFHDCLSAALAEFTLTLSAEPTSALRLAGAKEFIEVLLQLPDPVPQLEYQPDKKANLNPDHTLYGNRKSPNPGVKSN